MNKQKYATFMKTSRQVSAAFLLCCVFGKRLRTLNLKSTNNQIKKIPPEINRLKDLRVLNLKSNQILKVILENRIKIRKESWKQNANSTHLSPSTSKTNTQNWMSRDVLVYYLLCSVDWGFCFVLFLNYYYYFYCY